MGWRKAKQEKTLFKCDKVPRNGSSAPSVSAQIGITQPAAAVHVFIGACTDGIIIRDSLESSFIESSFSADARGDSGRASSQLRRFQCFQTKQQSGSQGEFW